MYKKRELIQQLIKFYTQIGKEIAKHPDKALSLIFTNYLRFGVCYCARQNFSTPICHTSWVEYWMGFKSIPKTSLVNNDDRPLYWGPTPVDGKTQKQILEAIELRIFILTMELESEIDLDESKNRPIFEV